MALSNEDITNTMHLHVKDVASQYGVSVSTVNRARKRLNLKPLVFGRGRPKTNFMAEKSCPSCNTTFTAWSKYCSVSCYVKDRPKPSESASKKISEKAKLRWQSPTNDMLRGIEKRKLEDLSEYKHYRNRLKTLTEKTYLENLDIINPNRYKRGIAGIDGHYHLDHIIPARFGFENRIPVEHLAKKENLQMLSWRENIVKGRKHNGEME
jgi:hypothetical protein